MSSQVFSNAYLAMVTLHTKQWCMSPFTVEPPNLRTVAFFKSFGNLINAEDLLKGIERGLTDIYSV